MRMQSSNRTRFSFLKAVVLFLVPLHVPLHVPLLFFSLNASSLFAQGRLQRVTNAVDESDPDFKKRRPKRKNSYSSAAHHNDHYGHDDDVKSLDKIGAELLGGLFLIGASSPWWGPHMALADSFEEPATLLPVPYENGHHGGLDIVPFSQGVGNDLQIRFLADYGTDFSGLERLGGQVKLDTSSRFGIDTSWNRFTEELDLTGDTLWLGDANLTYRFAQNEAMQFHTGLGMNWLNDAGRTDLGANFTYGFELYPRKPWVIRGVVDLGRLGDTSRVHFRGDVGFVWKRFEIFTGYDIERISNINLQTWTSGIQFRY